MFMSLKSSMTGVTFGKGTNNHRLSVEFVLSNLYFSV